MSFVNDVMAEEADRKGLILFEGASGDHDAEFSPVHDNAVLKKKYWFNFLLVMITLLAVMRFVDQLPVSHIDDSQFVENRSVDQAVILKVELPSLKPLSDIVAVVKKKIWPVKWLRKSLLSR